MELQTGAPFSLLDVVLVCSSATLYNCTLLGESLTSVMSMNPLKEWVLGKILLKGDSSSFLVLKLRKRFAIYHHPVVGV